MPSHRPFTLSLQARLAEEAERLAAQQRAAAEAQDAAAATLRAVQEDIDEETQQLKGRCVLSCEVWVIWQLPVDVCSAAVCWRLAHLLAVECVQYSRFLLQLSPLLLTCGLV